MHFGNDDMSEYLMPHGDRDCKLGLARSHVNIKLM